MECERGTEGCDELKKTKKNKTRKTDLSWCTNTHTHVCMIGSWRQTLFSVFSILVGHPSQNFDPFKAALDLHVELFSFISRGVFCFFFSLQLYSVLVLLIFAIVSAFHLSQTATEAGFTLGKGSTPHFICLFVAGKWRKMMKRDCVVWIVYFVVRTQDT